MITIFKKINNLSIQNKIFLSGCMLISVFAIFIFSYFLPQIKDSLIEQRKVLLKNITETGISILKKINNSYINENLTEEEARTKAIGLIKHLRYGPEGKDYLWINDFNPNMIMHPYVSSLNGKDLSDYKDPNGKRLFVEFVKVCEQDGEGYVDYMWQWKDDKSKIVPKLSFVKAFKPWGWIIGTGMYLEDVNKDIQLYKIRYSIIIISLTIGMLIFCYVISKSISRPLVKIVQSLKEVSTGSGDLTKRIHKNKVNCSKFLKCNYHDCQLYDKEVTDCINIVGSRAPNFGNKIKCPSILNGTYKSCEECKIMEKIIPNELSELTFYFDSFVLKIHNIIKEAQEVAEKLTEYSKGLASESLQLSDHVQGQAASAEEITATVEEMSAGISNVSTRAGHQSTSLLSMISKMQELSDYIAKMGTVINDTEKQTEIINNDAKSGVSSLKEMNNSMQNVHDSSDEMKNIVDIINEISDKINLLSLNAAIESARAGEAGRGFSVVSDEISKLADQTAVSIKDISNLIKVNSNEITKGIKKLDESLEKIHTIMNGVNTIFEMMNKISDLMNKQSEMNESVNEETDNVKRFSDEIRTATEEQNTAANEIVKSITNINELTQTNASSVEEMTSTMKTINDMAENLQSKVSLFKV